MRRFALASFALILLCHFVSNSNASAGDRDDWFNDCVYECSTTSSCFDEKTNEERYIPSSVDWALNLMRWTCSEDCRYNCARNHTVHRVSQGLPPLQYNGKWPFVRVLGTQEWFSSIFSLGNFLPALWAFYSLLTDKKSRLAPNNLRFAYISYTVTAMLAWICSAWFHARDSVASEYADYFMADLFVAYGLAICLQRVFDLRSTLAIVLLHLSAVALWAKQASYLAFVKFDYGWNTTWGISVNVVGCSVWLIFCYQKWGKRSFLWKLIWFEVFGWMAAMNEVFDYAPLYDLLDAHAVWHGATMPLAVLFWSFVLDDCRFEGILEDTRHKVD